MYPDINPLLPRFPPRPPHPGSGGQRGRERERVSLWNDTQGQRQKEMSLRVRELTFLDPNVSDQCLISLLAFFAFYLRIRRRHQHVTRSSVLELSGSSTQPTDIYSLV